MKHVGNSKLNSVFEENLLLPKLTPTSDRNERAVFIKTKYAQKTFIKPSTSLQIDMSFLYALQEKPFDIVKLLRLFGQGANVDFQTEESKNKTALMLAVLADNLLAVEFLLQNGANTLLSDDRNWSCLHYW